jgi:hypothetical protein
MTDCVARLVSMRLKKGTAKAALVLGWSEAVGKLIVCWKGQVERKDRTIGRKD